MLDVYVDADACPVKAEVYRVARRYLLRVYVVANGRLAVPSDSRIVRVSVPGDLDAADDWIAGRIGEDDVCVTSDLPLVRRCLDRRARVLGPDGKVWSEDSIGEALATRNLLDQLRGMGERTGGPPPYGPRDRSRFLSRLDEVVQAVRRTYRS